MTQAPANNFPGMQPPPTPPAKSNTWMVVLFGCLGAFVVCVIVCGGVAWYVMSNVKNIAAEGVKVVAVQAINQSQLPDDQKKGVISHIDRVTAEFKSGKITLEQLGKVLETVSESPLLYVGAVYHVRGAIIQPSGLSADEKKEADRSAQRVARGLYEKKLVEADMNYIADPIMIVDANGEQQLKPNPTDDEVREFAKRAKEKADAVNIPDEDFTVDIADELGKAIDKATANP
ncbi:MAG: hypothetical protein GC164_15415 [Phycisphaera sp.]|nr:hypothetical protein [Phycisphaera sp.]